MPIDRGGRPRLALRVAMVEQARALFDEQGPFTVVQLVDRVPGYNSLAPSELRAGRQTVQAMCRAGELVAVGTCRVPGSRRPANLYAPAGASPWWLPLLSWPRAPDPADGVR